MNDPTVRTRAPLSENTALLEALLVAQPGEERERLWVQFVRRYDRLILSCVLKALRRYGAIFSREDLEDLTGEVWLALLKDDLRKLRQYDVARGSRLATFLGLVSTNLTIDYLRARRGETTALDDVVVAHLTAHGPRDLADDRERAGLARRALRCLSDEEQAFVFECFHEERAPEEMARSRGITVNTAYARKFKVREKLQKIVARLEAGLAPLPLGRATA
jgi:RNA polymerase sigma factor (sigma-70 family)